MTDRRLKVLVTGGAGFIGSHVARMLLRNGHEVTVLDNLSNGDRGLVPDGASFVHGELSGGRTLASSLAGQDVVIHLAAFVPVPTSIEKPVEFAENNVLNTVRLLEAMRASGVRRLVFSSSATVYGNPNRLPITEDHPIASPSNPYGASKIAAEGFVSVYHRLHGFDVTILRYFNPYGPDEICRPETHLVPNAILAGLEDRPVPVFWAGEQIRDFIYVEDLARAHVDVLPLSGLNVLNVGAGVGVKVSEVLALIEAALGRQLALEDLGERPGDVPALYASSQALRSATGWQPQVSLDVGLRRTVEYFRSRAV